MTGQDALLIVDVQNDFCPGGFLPIPDGDAVAPILSRWIAEGGLIVASRDWHPRNHSSFKEQGGPWPPHCIQNTPGAEFHRDLQLPKDALIISKGTHVEFDQYSALDRTGLAEELRQRGIERVWIGGVALDVCVRATVLDALAQGFKAHLILDATRAINVKAGDDQRAVSEMQAAGAMIVRGQTG